MTRRVWRQDPKTGKLYEIEPPPYIPRGNLGPEGEFVSPIDQSVISTQAKLYDHNKRHNVAQLDGQEQDWAAAEKQREKWFSGESTKEDRIRDIRKAMGDEL